MNNKLKMDILFFIQYLPLPHLEPLTICVQSIHETYAEL